MRTWWISIKHSFHKKTIWSSHFELCNLMRVGRKMFKSGHISIKSPGR